jgi:m7GpppX diphosphatase
LLGSIDGDQSLLTIERAAFPSSESSVIALLKLLSNVKNLGANDVYHWYMASTLQRDSQPSIELHSYPDNQKNAFGSSSVATTAAKPEPDLKLNLIHPCTSKHIKKYSPQKIRMVTETPHIYRTHIKPYMEQQRSQGRLQWVYNILDGHAEQEDIILRQSRDLGKDPEGFLLLPDMNWDRVTMGSLRILGLVERRDLMSLRDLTKKDVPWLRVMLQRILTGVEEVYADQGVQRDELKVYVHCMEIF